MALYYYLFMSKIRFLEQQDLRFILDDVKNRIGITPVPSDITSQFSVVHIPLERGFISFADDREPYCEFVVSYGNAWYKFVAQPVKIDYTKQRNEGVFPSTIILPSTIDKPVTPYQNFAFKYDIEDRIFKLLEKSYKREKLDAEGYLKYAKLAGTSRKELLEKIVEDYKASYGGVGGSIGLATGLAAWYFLGQPATTIPIATATGAMVEISLPIIAIGMELRDKKRKMIKDILATCKKLNPEFQVT